MVVVVAGGGGCLGEGGVGTTGTVGCCVGVGRGGANENVGVGRARCWKCQITLSSRVGQSHIHTV